VFCLKSSILTPPNFVSPSQNFWAGYVTERGNAVQKFLGWLRYWKRFPAGGSRTLGVCNTTFGVQNAILRAIFCICSWMHIFQKNRGLWRLACAIAQRVLSSLIIPTNITKLTIVLKVCIAISDLRCGYHVEDGRWCDCRRIVTFKCLWRDCCLMLQNSNVSGVQLYKVVSNWVQKPGLL